jgi:hypothetical protein
MDMKTVDDDPLDMNEVEADISAGAKAFTVLLEHTSDDWGHWTIVIRGFRALRNLAFAQAQTSDIKSYAYRQKIGELLGQRKYSPYAAIDKQTRSTCYKLMDQLEEIHTWYISLPPADQLRWKHPDAIAKHCPHQLLAGGRGHNRPPKRGKKPASSAEVERLKALLIKIICRLAKHEPDAVELIQQVHGEDPNDSLEDI